MATLEMRPRQLPGREVIVEISFQNGKISVAPDPFYVSKHTDEEVRWISKEGDDFLVDFKLDSPFYESQFNQDSAISGLARRNVLPKEGRLYKYTVWVRGESLDPGGGVKP